MYLPHVRGGRPQARDISLPIKVIPFYLKVGEKSTTRGKKAHGEGEGKSTARMRPTRKQEPASPAPK